MATCMLHASVIINIYFFSAGCLHVSIEANGIDKVAMTAPLRSDQACPLPYKDFFASIRSAVQAVWQKRWEDLVASNNMGEITTRAVRP